MHTIRCPQCGESIAVDRALALQAQTAADAKAQTELAQKLAAVRAETAADTRAALEQELRTQHSHELAEMHRQLRTLEASKSAFELTMQAQLSEREAAVRREQTEKTKKMLADLTASEKKIADLEIAKAEAERAAQKTIAAHEAEIRRQEREKTEDGYLLRVKELEKQLSDTTRQLVEAKRTAEQGSQQTQGEVLELALEEQLRAAFYLDTIEEVAKGAHGADVRQVVRNLSGTNCGLILWECKNAEGDNRKKWLEKLKEDMFRDDATVGILVWASPKNEDEIKCIEQNLWLVKPRYAVAVATALRNTILQVHSANQSAENKDKLSAALFDYINSDAFKARIQKIIGNYEKLRELLEKEKNDTHKRWGKQEKIIAEAIDTTYTVDGELQHYIENFELPALPAGEIV